MEHCPGPEPTEVTAKIPVKHGELIKRTWTDPVVLASREGKAKPRDLLGVGLAGSELCTVPAEKQTQFKQELAFPISSSNLLCTEEDQGSRRQGSRKHPESREASGRQQQPSFLRAQWLESQNGWVLCFQFPRNKYIPRFFGFFFLFVCFPLLSIKQTALHTKQQLADSTPALPCRRDCISPS